MKTPLAILCAGISFVASLIAEPCSLELKVPSSETTFNGGMYTVIVPQQKNIPNRIIGPSITLNPDKFLGRRIRVSAEMRYTGIRSDVTGAHVGAKILVIWKKSNDMLRYCPSPSLLGASNGWQKIELDCTFPAKMKSLNFIFGIQQAWGKLEIRNPQYEILDEPRVPVKISAKAGVVPLKPSLFECGRFGTVNGDTLTVRVPEKTGITNQTRGANLRLDTRELAGKQVVFRAQMRTRNVESDAKGEHVGAKILAISTVNDIAYYYFTPSVTGTQDWQEVSANCNFAKAQESMQVVFGIQQAWGEVDFRNISLEIIPQPELLNVEIPKNFQCEYSSWIRSMPMMRGVMSPPPRSLKAEDIEALGKMGANLLRYQMVDGIRNLQDLDAYEKWLNSCLDKLDSLMDVLKANGIKVVIDMHLPPGGRYKNSTAFATAGAEAMAAAVSGDGSLFLMMEEPLYHKAFVEAWKKIATRYKGNPVIYGYDLVNEPLQRRPTRFSWLQLQYDAAVAIREIDPETPILIESNYNCLPDRFEMIPLPLKNIIYQVHMYIPCDYTHQGIVNSEEYGKAFQKLAWDYRDRGWNKEKLRNSMKSVIAFAKKYGAKIFVGEFSAVCWAPGAAQYLDDVISLFEEYRWDWTYHAFREWDGWSVEHAGKPGNVRPAQNTDRKQVLLKYFKKNQSHQSGEAA